MLLAVPSVPLADAGSGAIGALHIRSSSGTVPHHESGRDGWFRATLVKVSDARLRTPRPHPVAGARCVDAAVWRFITVAGTGRADHEQVNSDV